MMIGVSGRRQSFLVRLLDFCAVALSTLLSEIRNKFEYCRHPAALGVFSSSGIPGPGPGCQQIC